MIVALFYYLFLTYINSEIITIPITNLDGTIPSPKITTYPQGQCYLPLNTYISYSVFWKSYRNIERKENIIGEGILELDDNYEAIHYVSGIEFENFVLNKFHFYIAKEPIWGWEAGISFGYQNDTSFSIVHTLYKEGHINNLQFAFESINNFYIGGVPDTINLSNYTYKVKVKANETLPTWGFALNGIKHKGKVYDINTPCVIHSAARKMIVSDELYEIMRNSILKENIDNRECSIENTGFNLEQLYLECNLSNEKRNETIELNFDGFSIQMKLGYLFDGKYSLFLTNMVNHRYGNFNGTILGVEFVKSMNFMLFNYKDKHIELYSNVFPMKETTFNKNWILYLIWGNSILCMFNLIVLIYIINKK